MPRAVFSRLRVRLLVLILLAAVPLFGATILTGLERQRNVADTAQAEALRIARVVAFNQQQTIQETRALLIALSQIPAVRSQEEALCHPLLGDLLNAFPRYANFGVIGLDGRLSCSGLPFAGLVDLSDRRYFQQALATGDFATGDYQVGRITGKASINFGYPVFDADGEIGAVVFAALDLSWLYQLAVESQLPSGSTLTIVDYKGTILVRHPKPEQWVGVSLPQESLVETMMTQGEGTAKIEGLDGVARLYGFVALDGTTRAGYVSVGIPTAAAFSEADAILTRNLIGLVGLVSVFLILTWTGSELSVLRPVDNLLNATKRLRAGDLSARVCWSHGPAELNTLSSAFNEMAVALHNERDALEKSNQRLETLHQVDQSVLTGQPLEVVAGMVLESILHDVPATVGLITQLDLEAGEGVVLAAVDQREAQPVTGTRFSLNLLDDQDIATLAKGDVQVIGDVTALPQLPGSHPLRIDGIRSMVRVPLVSQGVLLGTIHLGADLPQVFQSAHLKIVREVADQLTIAFQHTRYRARIQRQVSQLEQRVMGRTEELQRAKNYVEAILTHIGDALVLVTADGIIQQTNPAFSSQLGYLADDAFGHNLTDLAAAGEVDNLASMLELVTKTGHPGRTEIDVRHKDGALVCVELALAPIPEHNGERPNVICSLRDITERKRAENELRRAYEKEKELNTLKSRFVSMVSHEFRNPLASILLSAEKLHRYADRLSADQKAERLKSIVGRVNYLTELIEDVLIFSRSEQIAVDFTPTTLDLAALCREVIEEQQAMTTSHRLVLSSVGDCTEAVVDGKLVSQLVSNLLSNAVKYSPDGGEVRLDLTCQDRRITIRVQDEGLGIPEEDQPRLFDTFHRASNVGKIAGTGLGLAIVRRAVEAHGGTITFESAVGVGTTFTVTLPKIDLVLG